MWNLLLNQKNIPIPAGQDFYAVVNDYGKTYSTNIDIPITADIVEALNIRGILQKEDGQLFKPTDYRGFLSGYGFNTPCTVHVESLSQKTNSVNLYISSEGLLGGKLSEFFALRDVNYVNNFMTPVVHQSFQNRDHPIFSGSESGPSYQQNTSPMAWYPEVNQNIFLQALANASIYAENVPNFRLYPNAIYADARYKMRRIYARVGCDLRQDANNNVTMNWATPVVARGEYANLSNDYVDCTIDMGTEPGSLPLTKIIQNYFSNSFNIDRPIRSIYLDISTTSSHLNYHDGTQYRDRCVISVYSDTPLNFRTNLTPEHLSSRTPATDPEYGYYDYSVSGELDMSVDSAGHVAGVEEARIRGNSTLSGRIKIVIVIISRFATVDTPEDYHQEIAMQYMFDDDSTAIKKVSGAMQSGALSDDVSSFHSTPSLGSADFVGRYPNMIVIHVPNFSSLGFGHTGNQRVIDGLNRIQQLFGNISHAGYCNNMNFPDGALFYNNIFSWYDNITLIELLDIIAGINNQYYYYDSVGNRIIFSNIDTIASQAETIDRYVYYDTVSFEKKSVARYYFLNTDDDDMTDGGEKLPLLLPSEVKNCYIYDPPASGSLVPTAGVQALWNSDHKYDCWSRIKVHSGWYGGTWFESVPQESSEGVFLLVDADNTINPTDTEAVLFSQIEYNPNKMQLVSTLDKNQIVELTINEYINSRFVRYQTKTFIVLSQELSESGENHITLLLYM